MYWFIPPNNQWSVLGQAKARSQELHSISHMNGRRQDTWAIISDSQMNEQDAVSKAEVKLDSQHSDSECGCTYQ